MSVLWTSQELEEATLGQAAKAFDVGGISINSRTLNAGDLFIAIKGDTFDGHDFVADALKNGAGGALVSHVPAGVGADAPLLVTAHTQRALEDIGVAARKRFAGTVVAVTGSVGKTTSKEVLRLAFGAQGTVHASSGSLNNHWGVPLTLSQTSRTTDTAIIEVGMNHFGEIRTLNSFVRPHLVLITTIAPAHIEFFGNIEAIADAKSEIFESLLPDGPALLPADSPLFSRLLARAHQAGVSQILSFGRNGDGRLLSYAEDEAGAAIGADIQGMRVDFRLGAPGLHNAMAAVAALLAVSVSDGDVKTAAAALAQFRPLKGRGERHRIGNVVVIDEAYNANPASVAAALSLLKTAGGRKIAVLGDMLELGAAADRLHAELIDAVESSGADAVFLCGPHMRALWDVLPVRLRGGYAQASVDLSPMVAGAVAAGDTVLVKGSNGSRMGVVIEALKAQLEG